MLYASSASVKERSSSELSLIWGVFRLGSVGAKSVIVVTGVSRWSIASQVASCQLLLLFLRLIPHCRLILNASASIKNDCRVFIICFNDREKLVGRSEG